jgi:uncharacterized DUF497 family protein
MLEWDPKKAASNKLKHRISFADTFGVFEDLNAITIEQQEDGEQRFLTLGLDSFGRVLVAAYTWRGDNIRIISARKATPREVKQYEEGI